MTTSGPLVTSRVTIMRNCSSSKHCSSLPNDGAVVVTMLLVGTDEGIEEGLSNFGAGDCILEGECDSTLNIPSMLGIFEPMMDGRLFLGCIEGLFDVKDDGEFVGRDESTSMGLFEELVVG